jgi:hypothetical protein
MMDINHQLNPVYRQGSTMISMARQMVFEPPEVVPNWRDIKSGAISTEQPATARRDAVTKLYVAALKKQTWSSARELAERLKSNPVSVARIMRMDHIKPLVERQSRRGKYGADYFIWRLK